MAIPTGNRSMTPNFKDAGRHNISVVQVTLPIPRYEFRIQCDQKKLPNVC